MEKKALHTNIRRETNIRKQLITSNNGMKSGALQEKQIHSTLIKGSTALNNVGKDESPQVHSLLLTSLFTKSFPANVQDPRSPPCPSGLYSLITMWTFLVGAGKSVTLAARGFCFMYVSMQARAARKAGSVSSYHRRKLRPNRQCCGGGKRSRWGRRANSRGRHCRRRLRPSLRCRRRFLVSQRRRIPRWDWQWRPSWRPEDQR